MKQAIFHKCCVTKISLHLCAGRQLLETHDIGYHINHNNDTVGDNTTYPQNCTPPSIEEFPEDFMTMKQRRRGGVIFHMVIVLYIFAALAIVCDDYFVSSLEKICNGNYGKNQYFF